jgi:hypothetical protein
LISNIKEPDGGVRPIHDCSHPDGTAVNDFVGHFEKQRFQTIDDAAKLVSKDYYNLIFANGLFRIIGYQVGQKDEFLPKCLPADFLD